ncbi:mechanosensitive ion channel family protein [Schaalia sp. 19OD2882]|uniref:mechanosensitive ion channel family protein n=1 Tax=Schaalia sp. 19OD2882 TaxID=2794089 RepID=UPI001C1F09DE|nr:mechanosensitive ion channel family protein [Schaalia sp. 19OD2882]QWW19404.1 mechanosensitive ion channel family protein [Schaalia sp. 19OD2882]
MTYHFPGWLHLSARLQSATPTDAPQSGDQASPVVEGAVDTAALAASILVGVGTGFVLAAIASMLVGRVLRASTLLGTIAQRIRAPLYVTLMVWGAWAGLQFAMLSQDATSWLNGPVPAVAAHLVLVLAITALTWVGWSAAWVFEDAARARSAADKGRARRFETQAQVMRRLLQLVAVLVGVVSILYTFEATRAAMATVLASAGVISVVAGLAAQQTLGNVFAGIQLAFTDAIRVGDVVVADKDRDSGAVEEITLSYVVVRMGDDRRLMVPSRHFTLNTFENWTRRSAKQLGTVELHLDWAAPMDLIRAKVEQILSSTDLWDGRTWAVQMSAADVDSITVRIQVSAENSGKLWDLRCHLREALVDWIVREEPWIRSSGAAREEEEETGAHEDALSPAVTCSPTTGRGRGEGQQGRRQKRLDRGSDEAEASTQVLSATSIARAVGGGKGERLYSGSAEAEERSHIWEGPGEDVLAEREEMTRRRDTRGRDDEDRGVEAAATKAR